MNVGGRVLGMAAGAAGVAAAGAAAGAAARAVSHRRPIVHQPVDHELELGSLRGHAITVVADDGVPLHAEVDEPSLSAAAPRRSCAHEAPPVRPSCRAARRFNAPLVPTVENFAGEVFDESR